MCGTRKAIVHFKLLGKSPKTNRPCRPRDDKVQMESAGSTDSENRQAARSEIRARHPPTEMAPDPRTQDTNGLPRCQEGRRAQGHALRIRRDIACYVRLPASPSFAFSFFLTLPTPFHATTNAQLQQSAPLIRPPFSVILYTPYADVVTIGKHYAEQMCIRCRVFLLVSSMS